MPENGVRSTYSQCPFQILMYQDDDLISTGTAFFYERDGNDYIITNWHNISGLNIFTREFLDNNQHRRPTRIVAKLSHWISDGNPRNFGIFGFDVAIYSDDRQETVWLEHPELGDRCDVIAIPFRKPTSTPEFMHNYPNRISTMRIPVEPGNQVFVIGFPSSISVGFGLPLWKSGFIASEPFYDVKVSGAVQRDGAMGGGISLPAFFIDSATRRGMSGSPVFARYFGKWSMSDPYAKVDPSEAGFWDRDDIALGEVGMEFVGIYSGRVPAAENEAALGLCWKKQTIDDICGGGRKGRHPHL